MTQQSAADSVLGRILRRSTLTEFQKNQILGRVNAKKAKRAVR